MPDETTQVREVRLMNELFAKHGGTALAGLSGGSLPTILALFVGWQAMQTRDRDISELKEGMDAYKTLTVQVQSNAEALTRLQEQAHGDIRALSDDVDELEKHCVPKEDYRNDQNKLLIEFRTLSNKLDSDLRALRKDIEADYNRRMDKLETALFENARRNP